MTVSLLIIDTVASSVQGTSAPLSANMLPVPLVVALLPARASEQGNVIGSVSVYIYICHQKKIVIERSRDPIYLKVVATDFSLKIISPSAGENSGDLA